MEYPGTKLSMATPENNAVWPALWPIVLTFLLLGILSAQTKFRDESQKESSQRMSRVMPLAPQEKRPAQETGPALEGPIDPDSYLVGPGDIFLIAITGVEPFLEMVTVTPAGKLVVPEIGSFQVSSQTVTAVRELVLSRIREVFPTYDADCVLYYIRKIRVSISGAVYSPGFYEVTPVSRISDLVVLADGNLTNAAMHRVLRQRGTGESQTIDLTEFYYNGSLSQNPTLLEGDRVTVPFGTEGAEMASSHGLRPVMVIGEVNVPGAYDYQPGLAVLDYVALAGGPTKDGSQQSLRIIRATGEVMDKKVEVLAGDTVYVRRSYNSIFFGQAGMIQVVLTMLNLYMAYLAAAARAGN